MALKCATNVPCFGNAPASTSAVVQVKAEQQPTKMAEGNSPFTEQKHLTEITEHSPTSPTCVVEQAETESFDADDVSPVATTDDSSHPNYTYSGSDGYDDTQLTSPDASPKRVTIVSSMFRSVSSSPPQVAVAVHFVGAQGRACAHCRAVKTPLWRNGPQGPKTLCNACGIRFKLGKLQVSANGQHLEPAGTKANSGGRKRTTHLNDAPRTPPRKLRQFTRKAERFTKSFSQRIKQRSIKHREHAPSTPRRTQLPILTNHDGALLLLELAGVF